MGNGARVCLGAALALLLCGACPGASAQKDVIECTNLYNDQHHKLASIKDEKERHEIDCEAQKVQWDCLIRVMDNSEMELKNCVQLKVDDARKAYTATCDANAIWSWPPPLVMAAAILLALLPLVRAAS